MPNTNQPMPLFSASHSTLLRILETLPDALLVVDDAATIVYANGRAHAQAGATHKELLGTSLWRGTPRLMSTVLYQAVQRAIHTREPSNVAYRSPVTNRWLHVSLSPIEEGLALVFQQALEPPSLQHALSQNEQAMRELLERVADGVAILTPDGLVLDINQLLLANGQLRREEVVGRPLADLPVWPSDPAVQQRLQAAIAQASRGEIVYFEVCIHPRTDLSLDILMTITAHRDADQRVDYLICANREITERKHAEEELQTLLNAIPDFVWMAKPNGLVIHINQRLIDYLAIPLEQAEGAGWLASVHPDDQPRVRQAWQTAIETGEPYEEEYRIRDGTSGAYRWFLVRGVPQHDTQGLLLHWIGACTDIEKQKQAEERSKESEQDFRLLTETMPQLVWTMWPDGRLDYTNQRYRDVTGANLNLEGDEIWREFVHPDDIEKTLLLRHQLLRTGQIYENEYRLLDKRTGTYRWFLTRALPVSDTTGQVIKWFGTGTDIDEQKRTEQALRQSQERVNALMNSSIIGVTMLEGEQIVDANDTFLHMTGYTRDDLQAGCLNAIDMTAPDDQDRTRQAHQDLATQQTLTPYEKEYLCQDGSRLPVLVGGVVLQHHPFQAIGFVLDNSARKELEQRKDTFLSMASHELRNPLAALQLQTALLRRQLTRQGILDQAPALVNMERQIHTIIRLVEELLDVSKIQAGRLEYVWEPVDLGALLREIAETMQQTHPSHRILVRGAVQAPLMGDRDRLEQVFANLLSNAIKYSPGAETVEIDLNTSEDAATIQIHDHGLGIPREQRDKIFERFYRVADSRQRTISGLGMGLYIVAEIVKRHGGTITVDSVAGKGSTFTVRLPKERLEGAQVFR